jgi:hypothetical protein
LGVRGILEAAIENYLKNARTLKGSTAVIVVTFQVSPGSLLRWPVPPLQIRSMSSRRTIDVAVGAFDFLRDASSFSPT